MSRVACEPRPGDGVNVRGRCYSGSYTWRDSRPSDYKIGTIRPCAFAKAYTGCLTTWPPRPPSADVRRCSLARLCRCPYRRHFSGVGCAPLSPRVQWRSRSLVPATSVPNSRPGNGRGPCRDGRHPARTGEVARRSKIVLCEYRGGVRRVTSPDVGVPTYDQLLWPTINALRDLGGSGAISEINERVIELEKFSPEQQDQLHGDGPRTEIEYRLAWARTYLKMMGLTDNSSRGVWTLSEPGRSVDRADIPKIHAEAKRAWAAERAEKARKPADSEPKATYEQATSDDGEKDQEIAWKEELLEAVMAMPPDAFERLARRLLREAGFISVNVTGGTGDGGIDGLGIYRLSLVSFPVFFQCKRYKGSVSPSAVRDFRGAMAGRGDKGLLITTGSFTSAAQKEATRDGAPPVDLIDGDRLCDLLREYNLGVKVEIVQHEKAIDNRRFFDDI